MKRSEMLELITNILEENLDSRFTDTSHADTADYLLRRMERHMKPIKHDNILLRTTYEWDNE